MIGESNALQTWCIPYLNTFYNCSAPFDGHEPYLEVKSSLLKICLELATNAQRDLFAEHPVQVISTITIIYSLFIYKLII